jgi:hypothetical protein
MYGTAPAAILFIGTDQASSFVPTRAFWGAGTRAMLSAAWGAI